MKRTLYGEQDYTFGQLILTLRTAAGLTQSELADLLHVSRHAIGGWEAGRAYPKAEHLKEFIALCLQRDAFAAGNEEEEIRALWLAAHQKVFLDTQWLRALLEEHRPPPAPALASTPGSVSYEQPRDPDGFATPSTKSGPRVDWGEALNVPIFYGREEELALLTHWVVEERCRVVSVLGIGGVGKSALTVTLMREVATQFEVVIWRSLRDALSCNELLEECLQVLDPQALRDLPGSFEERLHLFMEQVRGQRVLLVLDNLETLLAQGTGMGHMRTDAQDYAHLLRRMGETVHQSCLLLTSREKPVDLVPLEGSRSPVRTLRLTGLDPMAGSQLLAEKDMVSSPDDQLRLIETYRGNPLALKIVAQTIVELFGGEIAPFLEQDEVIFGGVRELLREQFERISPLEQVIFSWLAILREPVSLDELLAVLSVPRASMQVVEALDALGRRSLIERGQRPGSFTLQSVVLEYITTRLIGDLSAEIEQGHLQRLVEYGLCLAQAKEYVRQTQEQLLVIPLLTQLQIVYQGYAELEKRLLNLLDGLRAWPRPSQGYGPANLVMLLRVLRGDLRDLNLSRLALRRLYLQGVEMQDTSLADAALEKVVFSEAFDAIFSVAISPDGHYWAAGSNSGEVRIWREEGQTAYLVTQAHTHAVPAVAFSPDSEILASGSWDCTVKLWNVASKSLIWDLQEHQGYVQTVAFRPDGSLLASGSDDRTVKLWDLRTGDCMRTFQGHEDNVYHVAWHPNGRLLASASFDQTIRIWDIDSGECVRTLNGHSYWVMGVAFTPDGKLLASGGADKVIKLWEVESGRCLQTWSGHRGPVKSVEWRPDGHTLVSGSYDTTMNLWQPGREMALETLAGHTDVIRSLALTPDGNRVLSGSEDRTLRVWELSNGQCLRILQGYALNLYAMTWSPDSHFLATGGTDCLITIWDSASEKPLRRLRGHTQAVYTLQWSPRGRLLASGGCDRTIRIWDSTTGEMLRVFQADSTQLTGVAWSPNGAELATSSYDQVVRLWDMTSGTSRWVGHAHSSLVSSVCWSPDGLRLATSGDHTVRLWRAADGTLLNTLQGHGEDIASVRWSPDGKIVASGGGGGGRGELLLWDAEDGHLIRSLVGHPRHVFTMAWSPSSAILVSASIDGTLRWWDVQSGACLYTRQAHQGWISTIEVSANGETLASSGHDGLTHLWDMASATLLSTLRADRPYERLSLAGTTGLTAAQKTTLLALGAIEGPPGA